MPDTDPVAAAFLAEIRERDGQVWYYRDRLGASGAIEAAKDDVPRLLKAVEAALTFHVEAVIEDMPEPRFRYCKTCSGHPAWPCPEVAAIIAELAGKEAP